MLLHCFSKIILCPENVIQELKKVVVIIKLLTPIHVLTGLCMRYSTQVAVKACEPLAIF